MARWIVKSPRGHSDVPGVHGCRALPTFDHSRWRRCDMNHIGASEKRTQATPRGRAAIAPRHRAAWPWYAPCASGSWPRSRPAGSSGRPCRRRRRSARRPRRSARGRRSRTRPRSPRINRTPHSRFHVRLGHEPRGCDLRFPNPKLGPEHVVEPGAAVINLKRCGGDLSLRL
jgi:hypothetical protein